MAATGKLERTNWSMSLGDGLRFTVLSPNRLVAVYAPGPGIRSFVYLKSWRDLNCCCGGTAILVP